MSKFLRWLLNEPPVERFDPTLVTAYRGSYTIDVLAEKVLDSNVTAILASGKQVNLTDKELENLIQDGFYFCGEHPLLIAMKKAR